MSGTRHLFLVKYGELALRGDNKHHFEIALERNIRGALGSAAARVWRKHGRLLVGADDEQAAERARAVLSSTFGIASFAWAEGEVKDFASVEAAALRVAARCVDGVKDFKIEARRLDKSFPLTSYEIACRLGDRILQSFPSLAVNVHRPELTIHVEIRELAYVYGPETPGLHGLPLGTSGHGLLLLSGGIDSPVAGYLMGFRGLRLDAVYFHTPPYAADEALGKVVDICGRLQPYLPGLGLWTVPFTPIQEHLRARAPEREMTLLTRACMMRIADRLGARAGCHALVTGESLGQVASQTPQSIRFTGSLATLPVLRPLIGMDKDQIIGMAKKIGTFDVSIRPYEDCCTLFAPRRPLIRPVFEEMMRSYEALELEALIDEAVRGAQWMDAAIREPSGEGGAGSALR